MDKKSFFKSRIIKFFFNFFIYNSLILEIKYRLYLIIFYLKKFRGKEYIGVNQCTFLIVPNGLIIYKPSKINVEGSANEVKKILTELNIEI